MENLRKLLAVVVTACISLTSQAYDFEVDGIYYDVVSLSDLTCEVVAGDNKYTGDIVIPSTVEYNGRTLSVTSIKGDFGYGESAFYCCEGLSSVVIGNNVTSLGAYAFCGCTGLTSIEISNSVTSIGNNVFSSCTGLISVNIPNSVKSLGHFVFSRCTSLTSVVLPNTLTSIGDQVFEDCTSLLSIDIPDSVTDIGEYAFYGCKSLTSVSIPYGLTSIERGTFHGCTSLTTIDIPNSTTSIGDYVFSGCTSLTSISLPNSVTSIGSNVFYGCNTLTSVSVGNSYSLEWLLKNFNKMSTLIIATDYSNTNLTGNKFSENANLKQIICKKLVPPTLKASFSNAQYMNLEVVVPSVSLADYKEAEGWKTFWGLQGNDECFFMVDSVLYEKTSEKNARIVGEKLSSECDIVINGTVKYKDVDYTVSAIADDAFKNCTLLKSISVNGISTIGNDSFYGCDQLEKVSLSDEVLSIGDNCFYGCKSLEGISLPSSLTELGKTVFVGCSSLKELRIEDSANALEIPYGEYYGKTGIQKKTVNGTSIRFQIAYYDGYFAGMPIEKLYIGRSLSDKSRYTLTVGSGVDPYIITTYDEPFNSLTNLKELTIGENVQTLGAETEYISKIDMNCSAGSFNKCDSIESITVNCQNPPTGAAFTDNVYAKAEINILEGTRSLYEAAEGWKDFFNREEDGIKGLYTDGNDAPYRIYDLQGHKLSAPQRGLNIINGKKVFVK